MYVLLHVTILQLAPERGEDTFTYSKFDPKVKFEGIPILVTSIASTLS